MLLRAVAWTCKAGVRHMATNPNPIVLENEKPGTPQSVWQVAPGQDSTLLQGFTTSISTDLGGQVDFKINNLTGSANYAVFGAGCTVTAAAWWGKVPKSR